MSAFTTKPLSPATWDPFAAFVERHNGVWGGCWCMAFHTSGAGCAPGKTLDHRRQKESLDRDSATRSALVFDGADCIGWCRYGSPAELPRIKGRWAYEDANPPEADWRITCFFVDKARRKVGVAEAALMGALEQMGSLGGRRVESFPEEILDRRVPSSFLHNGSLSMFERLGFRKYCKIAKHRWLVHKELNRAIDGS